MSEVITLLSSDEDVQEPPKKRLKPLPLDEVSVISNCNKKNTSDIVVLSDDESDNVNKTLIQNRRNSEYLNNVKDETVIIVDNEKQTIKNDNNIPKSTHGSNNINIVDTTINDESSSSGKENKLKSDYLETIEINKPSTSNDIPVDDTLLENFLQVCQNSITNSQYEHLKDKQFLILRKYYKKCGAKLNDSTNFSNLLEQNIVRAQKSAATAVISFNEIFQFVKSVLDAESVEVPEEHIIKLKKLEKAIKLLVSRIKHLEDSELNFDDEEDSTYLQLDRYISRLNKVHKKYCELLKKNPYSGRITYEKLDFVDSEYNEINRAISKKYKNGQKFPSYYEMEQFIKKVVAEHKLVLSEAKLKSESKLCFKKLGELLQNRRKKELYDAHYMYIRDNEDPAKTDKSLDSTLKQNFTEAQNKIDKICEEFIVKEEVADEVIVSEESDQSEEDSEKEEIK